MRAKLQGGIIWSTFFSVRIEDWLFLQTFWHILQFVFELFCFYNVCFCSSCTVLVVDCLTFVAVTSRSVDLALQTIFQLFFLLFLQFTWRLKSIKCDSTREFLSHTWQMRVQRVKSGDWILDWDYTKSTWALLSTSCYSFFWWLNDLKKVVNHSKTTSIDRVCTETSVESVVWRQLTSWAMFVSSPQNFWQ